MLVHKTKCRLLSPLLILISLLSLVLFLLTPTTFSKKLDFDIQIFYKICNLGFKVCEETKPHAKVSKKTDLTYLQRKNLKLMLVNNCLVKQFEIG